MIIVDEERKTEFINEISKHNFICRSRYINNKVAMSSIGTLKETEGLTQTFNSNQNGGRSRHAFIEEFIIV